MENLIGGKTEKMSGNKNGETSIGNTEKYREDSFLLPFLIIQELVEKFDLYV